MECLPALTSWNLSAPPAAGGAEAALGSSPASWTRGALPPGHGAEAMLPLPPPLSLSSKRPPQALAEAQRGPLCSFALIPMLPTSSSLGPRDLV